MKKSIFACLITATILLAGCSGQQQNGAGVTTTEKGQPSAKSTQQVMPFTYSTEVFDLKLPADYNKTKGNTIAPLEPGKFPVITYSITDLSLVEKPILDAEGLIRNERQALRNLCEQTENCGTMQAIMRMMIGGKTGVRYTEYLKGREMASDEGYLNIFRYAAFDKKYLYHFEAGANDLENPGQVMKQMDDIMKTVEFKK